jgi:hypothetical protein
VCVNTIINGVNINVFIQYQYPEYAINPPPPNNYNYAGEKSNYLETSFLEEFYKIAIGTTSENCMRKGSLL